MSCFDFSRIFKESAASESFWQLIAILDFNCPGPGPDGCGHGGEEPLIIEQSSFIITRFCANGRKRLMKGLKYVFDYTWRPSLILGGRGVTAKESSIALHNLIKNNFCLCFMTTESMALRVLFVCNFLLDETFHWNVFHLFVTWYHLGVRWQF